MFIRSSEKWKGKITVVFNNGYYTHGTTEIGSESDNPGKHTSAWGWINHLRSKNWWQPEMEYDFIREIKKHL